VPIGGGGAKKRKNQEKQTGFVTQQKTLEGVVEKLKKTSVKVWWAVFGGAGGKKK